MNVAIQIDEVNTWPSAIRSAYLLLERRRLEARLSSPAAR